MRTRAVVKGRGERRKRVKKTRCMQRRGEKEDKRIERNKEKCPFIQFNAQMNAGKSL